MYITAGGDMPRYRIVNVTEMGYDKQVTIEVVPGFWGRLFGKKTEVVKFHGGGTVWHQYPTGRRAGTEMEALICDLLVGVKMRDIPSM